VQDSLPSRQDIASEQKDGARTEPTLADEKQIVQRIQRGETELFYRLILPYERRVYVIASAILRNEADAEDVVQEALLKAFKNLGQFRAESRFGTWLVQIAINEARMKHRKHHRDIMKPIEDLENEDGGYAPRNFADWREIPSEVLERKEVREKLMAALASLAEKYREVFVLRDMQQMSTEDTATALGVSVAVIKTRLSRARLMLRDLLAPYLQSLRGSPSQFPKGTNPWS
jgi:RNA polymerase sigma-70 factor (ECF subfamily)